MNDSPGLSSFPTCIEPQLLLLLSVENALDVAHAGPVAADADAADAAPARPVPQPQVGVGRVGSGVVAVTHYLNLQELC